MGSLTVALGILEARFLPRKWAQNWCHVPIRRLRPGFGSQLRTKMERPFSINVTSMISARARRATPGPVGKLADRPAGQLVCQPVGRPASGSAARPGGLRAGWRSCHLAVRARVRLPRELARWPALGDIGGGMRLLCHLLFSSASLILRSYSYSVQIQASRDELPSPMHLLTAPHEFKRLQDVTAEP